jgi:hypothetical protein
VERSRRQTNRDFFAAVPDRLELLGDAPPHGNPRLPLGVATLGDEQWLYTDLRAPDGEDEPAASAVLRTEHTSDRYNFIISTVMVGGRHARPGLLRARHLAVANTAVPDDGELTELHEPGALWYCASVVPEQGTGRIYTSDRPGRAPGELGQPVGTASDARCMVTAFLGRLAACKRTARV